MQVVLVAENPNGRVAKIAHGLKSAGCEVVLLHKNKINVENGADYFDGMHQFRDENEALKLAKSYRPLAFHVFSLNVDVTSIAFVKEKPGKVVFDVYDTCEGIAQEWAQRGKPYQRYCLENADGVSARDLRLRWLRTAHGYRYRKAVFFMDYCWDRSLPPVPKISGDEIHLVAAGFILIEKQGHLEQRYLQVASDLGDQGIHLHIYPHPMQASNLEATFSEYLELAQRMPLLHIHRPIAFNEMTVELAQYHCGVAFSGAFTYGEGPTGYDLDYCRYCSASRIFDYLDAELPTLDNRKFYTFRFHTMSRYGVAIDADIRMLGDADASLRPLLAPAMGSRTRRARSAYAVRRHASRLIQFYKSL